MISYRCKSGRATAFTAFLRSCCLPHFHRSPVRKTGSFLPPQQTAVLVVCHTWRDSVMAGGQYPCCAVQLRALQPKALNAERLTCRWKRNRRLGGRSVARNIAWQRCRNPKILRVGSIPTLHTYKFLPVGCRWLFGCRIAADNALKIQVITWR